MSKLILLLFTFILSFRVFSLVDYTEEESSFRPPENSARKIVKKKRPSHTSKIQNKSSGSSGAFNLSTRYRSHEVSTKEVDGKVDMLEISGHFETSVNLFADFKYSALSTEDDGISKSSTYELGNPVGKLGFHWFRAGSSEEEVLFDMYAGVSKGVDSLIATSRTDQIYGVETSKKFYMVAFGLGYEMIVSGKTKSDEELEIGNIHKGSLAIGAQLTPDIQFMFEAGSVKIREATPDMNGKISAEKGLSKDVSYSYLNPSLKLGIKSSLSITLGAVFRTNRIKNRPELLRARLYNLPAAYGPTLYTGMNFSL